MLFVSSAIGLYFPFDFCLYPAMPTLVAFGLKFIPSAVALIVAVIVTLGAYILRYSHTCNLANFPWEIVSVAIVLLQSP